MLSSLRWVHLSDFHFGRDKYGEVSLAESIVEHIKSRRDPPDLVFITGDIAFSGMSDQYSHFNENVIAPLEEMLGEGRGERIFTVPGNHDLDRKKHDLVSREMLKSKRARFYDPSDEGLNQRKEIIERFQGYLYEGSTEAHPWIESESGVFTRKLNISGLRLGVLGVNTAWQCQDESDYGQIGPGANLVKEGLRGIADCDLRVVLGHHPLEWFDSEERLSIERMFRGHGVIYLHGHMHVSEAKWGGWPERGFLAVQAGAAFQAREDPKRRNRILYSEADTASGKLWVEPFTWSRKEGWVPEGGGEFPQECYDAGRWALPLPGNAEENLSYKGNETLLPSPPDGWQLVNTQFLHKFEAPSRGAMLAYFDGRVPSWPLALSPDVPRRRVVAKLIDEFLEHELAGASVIRLVSGAGGEGKSTVIMQVAAALAEREWNVFWRQSDIKGLPLGFAQLLSDIAMPCLIVTDDADVIADDLYENAQNSMPHVHFLLAARDTDWSADRDSSRRWGRLAGFRSELLNGLAEQDARLIVNAWSRYGDEGLGGLANVPLGEAAKRLATAAQDNSASIRHDGAFLGAMLQVRKGADLREHVASLLTRLGERVIFPQQKGEVSTLLDALAYIAAMHAENLLFLSKPVLAKVLGCKPGKLKASVLRPLGEEAAADSVGKFILTRHRVIAEVALELLSQRFHVDTDDLFVELSRAAVQLFIDRDPAFGPVPEIAKWNFISDHFFDAGRKELGIRIAMNLVDVEPGNPFLLNKLGQLYRKYGQPDVAVQLFRGAPACSSGNRIFYSEWATCEGSSGNHALNIWLDGLALSDGAERKRLTAEQASTLLSGLSLACAEILSRGGGKELYVKGCGAAASLGLVLHSRDAQIRNFLQLNFNVAKSNGFQVMDTSDSLLALAQVVAAAWQVREADLPDWISRDGSLEFTQLAALLT